MCCCFEILHFFFIESFVRVFVRNKISFSMNNSNTDRNESNPKKQIKKSSGSMSIEQKTEEISTEKSTPKYSDISDSESTTLLQGNKGKTVESTDLIPQIQNETRSITHFKHSDHQYSRISFYGSNEPPKVIAKEQKTIPNKIQCAYPAPNRSVCVGTGMLPAKQIQVVRPKPVIYRFQPNNCVQQPSPAYFVPNFITNPSTMFAQTSQAVRSIHKPNPSINTHTLIPTLFRSPTNVSQRPPVHHPIYYVSFCEPQKMQRNTNHM